MSMKNLFVVFAMLGMTLQGIAQSMEEQADRIGLIGFWQMTDMHGKINGEEFYDEIKDTRFYIFKQDGTVQYNTTAGKIATARWTLKGKTLHVFGKDRNNNPEGIDYTFTLRMVTPEKLVIMLGDYDSSYAINTYRKSNSTLRSIGTVTRRQEAGNNRLNDLKGFVSTAWSNVQAAYLRRTDLIPNLVVVIIRYTANEKETREALEGIINARVKATSINVNIDSLTPENLQRFQNAQSELSQALGRLITVSETYPDLKKDEKFIDLLKQLEETENYINEARICYNNTVKQYNEEAQKEQSPLLFELH